MKILAVSDVELETIYSKQLTTRFKDIDAVISCGDLPFYYLEFIISSLSVPLYYVRGNHHQKKLRSSHGDVERICGVDLHNKVYRDFNNKLFAGVEGSLRYNRGQQQYSQVEMWWNVFSLVPKLMINRLLYGRFLDVFVTHAPAWQIHDKKDLPHQGIKAFVWLDKVFKPRYHLHGHIHVYSQYTQTLTELGDTKILNTYGYKLIDI
ncbi:MAG: metallophosphoesterase family protein [Anaerolineaceae bacterium]|nr:metallophosphoesterase family protein [Anaerolineaceae bacterium]